MRDIILLFKMLFGVTAISAVFLLGIAGLIHLGSKFDTGEGVYSGRIVDIEWAGLIWKSCDVQFQTGEQSSLISSAATWDKEYCDELRNKLGQIVTVKYKSTFGPDLTLGSSYTLVK